MYQAAQPRLESVVQADYQQLRVKRLGTDSSAGTMDFDREVMLPNGNKIYFKSTQMNNWYKERHPSEVPRDHSFDREFIREALLEEFSRMSEEMGKIRVVMEKILSRKPLNPSPTTP